ncbi:MAG: primosomal protein N' (replication factor Y) [Planctomycetota bacterium]|jgi:primosomal protein N' (replication factor Y)
MDGESMNSRKGRKTEVDDAQGSSTAGASVDPAKSAALTGDRVECKPTESLANLADSTPAAEAIAEAENTSTTEGAAGQATSAARLDDEVERDPSVPVANAAVLVPATRASAIAKPAPKRDSSQPGFFGDTDEKASYADVAVNRPMRCQFTYRIPEALALRVRPGVRVSIPFGPRREIAIVVGITDSTDVPKSRIRDLLDVLDSQPALDADLLELTKWLAGYYGCSWGEAVAAVLPAAMKRGQKGRRSTFIRVSEGIGKAELSEIEDKWPQQHRLLRTMLDVGAPMERKDLLRKLGLSDSPLKTLLRRGWLLSESLEAQVDLPGLNAGEPATKRERPQALTEAQQLATDRMNLAVAERRFQPFLLWGVTGSGKTEVYLRVIEQALALGRSAIVLVPEIALTPQTVGWFQSRFGSVAVMHSRMTDAQRRGTWQRVHSGDVRVVVGARSALFAPVSDLGVIVVDEEHEPSFKQESTPRYNARDLAVVRARIAGAICILGSATPSLESWKNAQDGRYELIEMNRRVHGGDLPPVEVIDMRQEKRTGKGTTLFSRRLLRELEGCLERKEQAILFLNRRGFAPSLWCQSCGESIRCNQCDVTLTFHQRIGRAVCHSCCEEVRPPRECPSCTSPALRYLGAGSERVEEALAVLLPGARAARMDSDTMLRREDYEETLGAFGRGDLDVLVGTQMIAKGLDFPRVTLVGIVAADATLHLPDFRAAERTFQLLSQVAGRAGRGELPGRIIVQTQSPEHPAIVQASRHDYRTFAKLEGTLREELSYPPYGRLIRCLFEDADEPKAAKVAAELAALVREHFPALMVLGPAPAPFAQLRGRFRHHFLVKDGGAGGLGRARGLMLEFASKHHRPRVTVDVDPIGML